MFKSTALIALVALGTASAGCGGPHSTLRRTLKLSPLAPITPGIVQAAALKQFPLGSPRARVVRGLPPTRPRTLVSNLTPVADTWDVTMTDKLIGVLSGDYWQVGVGAHYVYIHFRFERDRLRRIDVGRSKFQL